MTARRPHPEPSLRLARGAVILFGAVSLLPVVSTGAGLLMGVAVALGLGNPWAARTKQLTTTLLQASIVGLGFGMDLHGVLGAGMRGLGATFVGLLLTLGAGVLLGRALGLARDVCVLVAVGTAICGGSAIAAVAPVLRARDADTTVALAVVFLLNAVGLLLFPPLGHLLDLSPEAFGLWAALAIHDTSSVVGAASAYADGALDIATSTKLARALWIVPLAFAVGRFVPPKTGQSPAPRPAPPWFILGFLAAAALVTFVPAVQPAGAWVAWTARRLLVLTLFLVGTNLTYAKLRAVGPRPLLHGVLLWIFAAGLSLAVIAGGWLG